MSIRNLPSKFKRKSIILGLSVFVFLSLIITINYPQLKKTGEVAGVVFTDINKFLTVDLVGAATTNPYTNVQGDVAISGKLSQGGGYTYLGAYNSGPGPSYPRAGNDLGISWNFTNGSRDVNFWNTDTLSPLSFIFRQLTGAASRTDLMALTSTAKMGVGTISPNGKLDLYETGWNGDGAVFAPDITTDNNFTIQTYIDSNIGGGGWAGRTTYAGGCCNNLALQPNVGTVSIGGTSGNYGTYKLNVFGDSYLGKINIGNNVWHTSNDGYNRFHFTLNGRSYFGSPDGYVWRSAADGDLMTLTNSGYLGVGMVPTVPFEVRGDGTGQYGYAFAVGGHNIAFNMSGEGPLRLCHSGADGSGSQTVVPIDCSAAGQVDLAEFYDTDGTLEPGDIVTIDKNNPSSNKVVKSVKANQVLLTGIVSTNPTADGILGFRVTSTNRQPIALAGRIPVKVSLENGPIKTGDALISSSTPGVAMKAGPEGGHLIGIAMENYDGTVPFTELTKVEENDRNTFSHTQDLPNYNSDPAKWPAGVGKIMVFMNITDYNPDLASTDNLNITDGFKILNQKTNELINKISAFAEIIVGKVTAGIIETKQLIVNGVDIVARLDAQQKEIDALKLEIENLKK